MKTVAYCRDCPFRITGKRKDVINKAKEHSLLKTHVVDYGDLEK